MSKTTRRTAGPLERLCEWVVRRERDAYKGFTGTVYEPGAVGPPLPPPTPDAARRTATKARAVWLHDWPHVCLNYRGDGSFISGFCFYCNNGADEPIRYAFEPDGAVALAREAISALTCGCKCDDEPGGCFRDSHDRGRRALAALDAAIEGKVMVPLKMAAAEAVTKKRRAREVWLHYPGGERVCNARADRDELGIWRCAHNLRVRKFREVLAPRRKP